MKTAVRPSWLTTSSVVGENFYGSNSHRLLYWEKLQRTDKFKKRYTPDNQELTSLNNGIRQHIFTESSLGLDTPNITEIPCISSFAEEWTIKNSDNTYVQQFPELEPDTRI